MGPILEVVNFMTPDETLTRLCVAQQHGKVARSPEIQESAEMLFKLHNVFQISKIFSLICNFKLFLNQNRKNSQRVHFCRKFLRPKNILQQFCGHSQTASPTDTLE